MKIKLLKITQSNNDSLLRRIFTMFNGNVNTVTSVQYGPYGEDSNPVKNSIGAYSDTELDGKEICLGVANKNAKAELGERRLYCTDENGNFKFNIWLRADGTLLQGDSEIPSQYTDFAVKFNELKTEFNELKSKYNDLVTKFNAHTHPYVNVTTPAVTSPTTTPGSASAANIDNAKNEKIKYNS